MTRICRSGLMFLITCLALAALGCSSSPAPAPAAPNDAAANTQAVQKAQGIPDWVMNPPSEVGQAFYGTGSSTYKSTAGQQRAFSAADAAARRQIADTMKTTIKGATKSYARQVLTDMGDVAEEALSQDVTVALTNFVLSGAAIVKHDAYYDPATKLTTVYSLSRIGFDSVAESLHNEMSKRVEQVQRNAESAFADLDRMLEDEQRKQAGTTTGQ